MANIPIIIFSKYPISLEVDTNIPEIINTKYEKNTYVKCIVMICNGMYSTTLCKHNLNTSNNCYYCIKPVSHLFNSHLCGTNPCIQCTMKTFQSRYELPIKSFEPALEIWNLSYNQAMKAQVGLGKCIDTQDPHCSHIQIMDVEKDLDQELDL